MEKEKTICEKCINAIENCPEGRGKCINICSECSLENIIKYFEGTKE